MDPVQSRIDKSNSWAQFFAVVSESRKMDVAAFGCQVCEYEYEYSKWIPKCSVALGWTPSINSTRRRSAFCQPKTITHTPATPTPNVLTSLCLGYNLDCPFRAAATRFEFDLEFEFLFELSPTGNWLSVYVPDSSGISAGQVYLLPPSCNHHCCRCQVFCLSWIVHTFSLNCWPNGIQNDWKHRLSFI